MSSAIVFILFFSSYLNFNNSVKSYGERLSNDYYIKNCKISEDTSKVKNIDYFKDSLVQRKNQFDKIIINQTTGDCFGSELLYYNQDHELTITEGEFGCSTEETEYLIIQEEGDYVFSQTCEIGDGLLIKMINIYYSKGKPFYGKLIEYNVDWEKYVIIDSLISFPNSNELIDLAKSAIDITSYFEELPFKIKEIEVFEYENGQVRLYFPDQQLDEEKYYLIDSIYFERIKNDH